MLLLLLILSEFIKPVFASSKTIHNKYAKTTLNIRNNPNVKSKICGQFYWNDKINVIQKENSKWYKIIYHGKIRYVASKYLKNKRCKYKTYQIVSNKSFKSYEDVDCITNNKLLLQGKLKQKYHLDNKTGVYMIGNRYCIALGQFYTKTPGIKVDLVLEYNNKKHILKCIAADVKAKKDTINKNKIHKDSSIAEFVVKTNILSKMTKLTGDISYAGNKFKGKIIKIKVYKEKK